MDINILVLVIPVLAQITFSEVNVPTLMEVVNSHCMDRCDKSSAAVNKTVVIEIIEERIREVKHTFRPTSCSDVDPRRAKMTNATGGVFTVYPLGMGAIEVYCDNTDGGEWTVFQRRVDGSVDFYRKWNDYRNGFGNRQGEFWLGLEALHHMTKNGEYEMRIDMIEKRRGSYRYAIYKTFSVGPESRNYTLKARHYSGNATNSLSNHFLQPFSTRDKDNDGSRYSSCAVRHGGAWWYASCYQSNLNGRYDATGTDGIRWWIQQFPQYPITLSYTEMKFRKKR